MTKKVTGSDLEKLIKEAMLNEFDSKLKINGAPVARKEKSSSRKMKNYEPGHVYIGKTFPEFPGKSGENLEDYSALSNTPVKRAANKFLFSKDSPATQLGINDIASLFKDASFDNGKSLKSTNKRHAMSLSHAQIKKNGTPEEKQTWNNSIYAMISNNRSFRELFGKGSFGPEFGYIDGATIPNSEDEQIQAYVDNWTSYRVVDTIDQNMSQGSIDQPNSDDISKIQQKRDLFNIDMRNYGSELGTFPPEIQTSMATMFAGVNTLTGRMKTLTDFSNDFLSILRGDNPSDKIKSLGLQKMISSVMVMDYLNSIIEDVDSGAGAYMFESFCAAIAGGKVEGKRTTDEGKMAAVDFTLSSGASGSSKFYSGIGGIEQAVNGFDDGDPVYYIVAIKNKSSSDEVLNIDLYTYTVVVDRSSGKNNITIMTPNRVEIHPKPQAKPGGMIKLNKKSYYKNETLLGTFQILRTSKEDLNSFRDAIKDIADRVEGKIAEVLPKMSEIQDDTANFSSNLNMYASAGKMKAGNAAVKSLINMKKLTKELFELFHGEVEYEAIGTSDLEENKITSDFLKKLIEESFKK
jgi:hypothetical protein